MTPLADRLPQARGPGGWQGLKDRVARLRNTLVADGRFQAFAASFPLTRPIASAQAGALFDLCAGFVYSQVLSACLSLDLFRLLEPGPLTIGQIASRAGLARDRADRLLKAASALKLLELRGRDSAGEARYGLAMLGAALVGNPGVAAMIAHHDMLYGDLADPVGLLTAQRPETRLASFWAYAGEDAPGHADAGAVAAYSRLMSASQQLVASDICAAYRFAAHRHIVDLGGGEGTFLTHVARVAPAARLTVVDLPAVAGRARAALREAGLSQRADALGADMHRDPVPPTADLVTLVRVLHDHDDSVVEALLRRLRRDMAPGATLLIAEPMADGTGTAKMADAYFGFYLLAMGSGRARTASELTEMLRNAGFLGIRRLKSRRPLLTSLLSATVPGGSSS